MDSKTLLTSKHSNPIQLEEATKTKEPCLTPTPKDLRHNLALLARSVPSSEPRLTTRAIRSLPALRKQLAALDNVTAKALLAEALKGEGIYDKESARKAELINYLGNPAPPAVVASTDMDVDTEPVVTGKVATPVVAPKKAAVEETPLANLPEADVYLSLLVLVVLLDQAEYTQAKALANSLIETVTALNRRSMDQLASKLYFFWVRVHELNGDDTGALRPTLLAAQRTAALRRDDDLQATLLPLLLRNYLEHQLYDQADRLVSKTTFPEGSAGNAQLARWYYYIGRIRAIQLNYTEAHTNLQQAIRRSPDAKVAPGFLQTAHKLSIVVELLMGDIPERSTFRHPVLKAALFPYLEIAQAVRIGDITKFNAALTTHAATFAKDSNSSLILRLRHNVIKTALRTISLAYSRIPLRDVSKKLDLDSEEDAEYIVAKAIRDGVIEASIDHEKGFMQSKKLGDVYATNEPQIAFDTRIKFLLELHNQSVKAMRYPLHAHSKDLASAGEAREREKELAKEIEDADEDGDIDGAGDVEGF